MVWETQIGAENGKRGEPGRVMRETADGAVEIAAGEGSVIVKIAQFEGGVEGTAREALSETARVADTIQFD
jgi:methionyl-tRNA formyltransferase